MKMVISPVKRMQALALFTMANQNYLRSAAYGKALAECLGYKDDWAGGFGDEYLQDGANFDEAFKNEGFTVRKRKVLKKRKAK